jgi:hypothetical protein
MGFAFNQAVNEENVNEDNLFVMDDNGIIISTTLSVAGDGRSVTVVPEQDYEYGKTYYLVISDSCVRPAAGPCPLRSE